MHEATCTSQGVREAGLHIDQASLASLPSSTALFLHGMLPSCASSILVTYKPALLDTLCSDYTDTPACKLAP